LLELPVILSIYRKPAGNLHGRFPANPSLTDPVPTFLRYPQMGKFALTLTFQCQ
jgi:hypothetical protein